MSNRRLPSGFLHPRAIASHVAIVLALLASPALSARPGTLDALVTDQNGTPIGDAAVTISNPRIPGFGELILLTDVSGRFRFEDDRTKEEFCLWIIAIGFCPQTVRLTLHPGKVINHTFKLPRCYSLAIPIFNRGVVSLNSGDSVVAERRMREAIDQDAGFGPAHAALAQILIDRGQYLEATGELSKALEIDPSDKRALSLAYEAKVGLGDPEAARRALIDLELVGGDSNLAARISESGFSALMRGDLDTARTRFEEAIVLSPALIRAHTGLLEVAMKEGRNRDVLEIAARLLDLDPTNGAARSVVATEQREPTEER